MILSDMHRVAALLVVFTCLFTLAVPASAQDNQTTQVLPDIAPRVVEIRGNLELSLPSLQRQPLVGFNPPPRVAPIPPDRHPYVEEYKQESIDLPPSPLEAPQPPPVASLIGGTPLRGSLEAAGGRYLSRSVRFRSEWSATDAAAIYSRLDYEGAQGHEPDGVLDEVTASSDALDALVGLQTMNRWVTVGFELDGFMNAYRLFGAQPASGYGELRDDPPYRDGRGGGARLWMVTQAATGSDIDLSVRYGVASYETDALRSESTASDEPFLRSETALEVDGGLIAQLSDLQDVLGDVHFTGLGFDDETVGSNVRILDAAGGLKVGSGQRFQVSGLARIMTFAAGDSASGFYASPDFLVSYSPANELRVYLQNDPRAEHRSTASMYRESPFLLDEPAVQPTIYTVDARAGTRIQAGVFEADLHAGLSRAPNFRYFERAAAAESHGFARGLVAADYEDAEIRYAGGDLSVVLPAGLVVSAGMTVRDGMLTDEEEEIPYFGSVLARGSLSYSFLDGRGFVRTTSTFESSREVDTEGSRRLGDYFDLDVDASYGLTESLAALLRLRNLSDGYLERWEYHEQSPFIVSVGFRAQW